MPSPASDCRFTWNATPRFAIRSTSPSPQAATDPHRTKHQRATGGRRSGLGCRERATALLSLTGRLAGLRVPAIQGQPTCGGAHGSYYSSRPGSPPGSVRLFATAPGDPTTLAIPGSHNSRDPGMPHAQNLATSPPRVGAARPPLAPARRDLGAATSDLPPSPNAVSRGTRPGPVPTRPPRP